RLDDAGLPDLVDPERLELRHVLPVDLVELRVALRFVRAGVRQPVVRLALGLRDAIVRNLRDRRPRKNHQNRKNLENPENPGNPENLENPHNSLRRLERYATRSSSSGAV